MKASLTTLTEPEVLETELTRRNFIKGVTFAGVAAAGAAVLAACNSDEPDDPAGDDVQGGDQPDNGPENGGAAQDGADLVDIILTSYSAGTFSGDEVPIEDINTILKCAARACSARNLQPWHFTVITGDLVLDDELARHASDGNVNIVVSKNADGGSSYDADCGIAIGYLCVAAAAMGYGFHVYMSTVGNVDAAAYEIPEEFEPFMVITIGVPDADAASAASERVDFDTIVNYVS